MRRQTCRQSIAGLPLPAHVCILRDVPLSWNEIRHRAITFAKEWKGENQNAPGARRVDMNSLIRAFLVRVAFRVACMFALLCACTASPAQPATNEVQTAFYEILGALDANQFAQFADALNLSDKAAVSNVVN